jgi:S-adenosylmethionine decarboxylase
MKQELIGVQKSERRFHIVVDAVDCDPKLITDKKRVEKALRDIAQLCEMRILHGPVIIEGLPINPGITGFTIVDFSHIAIHTFTPSNEMCVDVFSCKKYDFDKVKDYVVKTFKLDENKIKYKQVK